MRKKPSKKLARGLGWIYRQARADLEHCSGEKGTGQFSGTTEKEVDEALDWLNSYIHSRDGDKRE